MTMLLPGAAGAHQQALATAPSFFWTPRHAALRAACSWPHYASIITGSVHPRLSRVASVRLSAGRLGVCLAPMHC